MNKTFAAMVAVAAVAGALNTTPAHAQRGVAAGVAAGLIGGAIIGGAIASSRPAYGAPVYVEEAPYPACRMVRERFWDGYGWRVRRYEVCNSATSSQTQFQRDLSAREFKPGPLGRVFR